MSELKFWDILDYHIQNPPIPRLRPTVGFHPSDASVEVVEADGSKHLVGACNRQIWYKRTGVKPSTPIDADNLWKMKLGDATHETLVEACKRAGIYVGDEIEFYDAEHKISGRIDLVIKHPVTKKIIGIEIKSIAGYNAQRNIIKSVYGSALKPKPEHVLQAGLYLDWFSKHQNIHEWQIVYITRDEGTRNQFSLTLSPNKEILVDGSPSGMFTEGIYKRYKELEEALKVSTPPPRDYELQYSRPRLLKMANDKELTKAQSELVLKGKMLDKGDFQCRFCPWQKNCYGDLIVSNNDGTEE